MSPSTAEVTETPTAEEREAERHRLWLEILTLESEQAADAREEHLYQTWKENRP